MPRRQDPVWRHFIRTAEGKGFKAKCNKCAVVVQGHVDRLESHVEMCSAIDGDEDIQVVGTPQPTAAAAASTTTTTAASGSRSGVAAAIPGTSTNVGSHNKRQRAISRYICTTTKCEKETFDKAVSINYFTLYYVF